MIRYALKCSNGHGFESWFQSAEAFEKVSRSGMVTCTECGDSEVEKSIMAPRIGKSSDIATPRPLSTPQDPREAALKELREKITANSEDVGTDFSAEARKIHNGEAPARSIIGEAKLDEAKSLVEDGIPVAPLPFLPTRKSN